jgi:hypothetical protein
MLVTLEFADAGVKTGSHRACGLQRNAGLTEPDDIGLPLAEGKQLLECVRYEFVAAQTEEIVARARTCPRCGRRLEQGKKCKDLWKTTQTVTRGQRREHEEARRPYA